MNSGEYQSIKIVAAVELLYLMVSSPELRFNTLYNGEYGQFYFSKTLGLIFCNQTRRGQMLLEPFLNSGPYTLLKPKTAAEKMAS